jgi:hypothetical protein
LVVGDGAGAGGGGTAPTGSLPPGSSGGGAGTVLPPDAAQAGRAFTLRAPSRQRLATARRRGVRFRAEAAEPGRLAVKVLVGRKLARRLKLARKASGAVKIGRSKVRLRQGTSSHRIKLSRKARARLKRVKPPRVRLRASFRTADGEVHVQTRRVRLTRGRR